MEKIYGYRNEKFLVTQAESKCEYNVKHAERANPILTLYVIQDRKRDSFLWAGKGPNLSLGTDGSFRSSLDACCKHIISALTKGPTEQERCEEAQQVFDKL